MYHEQVSEYLGEQRFRSRGYMVLLLAAERCVGWCGVQREVV